MISNAPHLWLNCRPCNNIFIKDLGGNLKILFFRSSYGSSMSSSYTSSFDRKSSWERPSSLYSNSSESNYVKPTYSSPASSSSASYMNSTSRSLFTFMLDLRKLWMYQKKYKWSIGKISKDRKRNIENRKH